jgi:hypothetical protein
MPPVEKAQKTPTRTAQADRVTQAGRTAQTAPRQPSKEARARAQAAADKAYQQSLTGGGEVPELAAYRLLVGVHEDRDYDAAPQLLPDGSPNPTWRRPAKTYTAPATVWSATDLVKTFGAQKFQYAGRKTPRPQTPSEPSERMMEESPSVAPHGQVSTGHPKAGGRPLDQEAIEEGYEDVEAPGNEDTAGEEDEGDEKDEGEGQEGDTDDQDQEKADKHQADMESKTVDELRTYAQRRGVDIRGARTKGEILEKIQEAEAEE